MKPASGRSLARAALRLSAAGVLFVLSVGLELAHAQSVPSPPTTASLNMTPAASVDAALRKEIVEALAQKLINDYAVADLGAKAAQAMRAKYASGAYDNIASPEEFARALHKDLREALDDRHLRVTFEKDAGPPPSSARPPGPRVQTAPMPPPTTPDKLNGALRRVQILPGNVGYLQIDGMLPMANAAIDAAFAFLHNTDALILDLRANGGGAPETVAYYMSYLSAGEPYTVIRIKTRHRGITETRTTNVGDRSYGAKKPVYVLTSYMTFSGGEEFAYDVQGFKRGLVIGETTGGGANPGGPHPLGHGFTVFVPFGIVEHPKTGSNWEGIGVKPDVPVSAGLALLEAHRLAIESLRREAKDDSERMSLETLANTLAAEKKRLATTPPPSLTTAEKRLLGVYAPVTGVGPIYSIVEREGALALQPTSTKPPSRLLRIRENTYQLDGLPEGVTATFLEDPSGTQLLLQQAHWVLPLVLKQR